MEFNPPHISGHKLVAKERYQDGTRHMIEFDSLTGEDVGRMRLYLSEDGYADALKSQSRKLIKIRRHAFVIEGNLVYDKKNKTRRH